MSGDDIKTKRFRFLHRLYEESEGQENRFFSMFPLGADLKFDPNLTSAIAAYLKQEGLIRKEDLGSLSGRSVAITHAGIKEVENAKENPNRSTTHFSPQSINYTINVQNSPNAQVMAGVSDSNQTLTLNEAQKMGLREIFLLLNEISSYKQLRSDQKDKLEAGAQNLDREMQSGSPRIDKVKSILSSAKEVLESVSGIVNTTGPLILKINSWMKGSS